MPLWTASIGIVFLLGSLCGIYLSLKENVYASPLVRLQRERDHTLVSTGPYAHLRHPLYSSAFLFYIGTPMLLGSWWGLGFAPVFIGLIIYRAVQEERLLCNELAFVQEIYATGNATLYSWGMVTIGKSL
jgi:protein-S-isoprenylcysteine O-methyltransferase Ste14